MWERPNAVCNCNGAGGEGTGKATLGLLDLSLLSCSNMQLSHFAIKANFLSLLLVALHSTPVFPPDLVLMLVPLVNKSPTTVSAPKPTNWQSHPFSSYFQSLTAHHVLMYVLVSGVYAASDNSELISRRLMGIV